jgi:hypothetical protein
MSGLLATIIASLFLVTVGSGISTVRAKALGDNDSEMTKRGARLDFKVAENRANAHYKFAISECKKQSSPDRTPCLDAAKAVNGKLIVAAKEQMDKTLAAPFMPNKNVAVAVERRG